MSDFFEDPHVVELDQLFKAKHAAKEIRLLNVGTNNPHEHHWRFRTKSGEIVNVSATKETP